MAAAEEKLKTKYCNLRCRFQLDIGHGTTE